MKEDNAKANPNGTMTFWLEGEKYELRRPKVGEYRKFMEVLKATPGEDEPKEEEADRILAWWGAIFEGLSDKPLGIGLDELPLFMIGQEFIRDAVEHWRSSPLARSNQQGPQGPMVTKRFSAVTG